MNNTMQKSSDRPRVGLFVICTFLYWVTVYTYVPTMTPYLADLGISFMMIGLIGGSYGFSQMLLRLPLGVMSDRLGKRKVFIIFGLFMGAASSFGMFFTQNAFFILTLRLLAGVSASAWVVFMILFSSYYDKDKLPSRVSYLLFVNSCGFMAAKFAGGVVAEHFGHEYTFLLGGLAGLLATALGLFITERTPNLKELPTVRKLLGVVRNRNLVYMSILAVFSQMVMHSTINTFTSAAASNAGADLMQLGVLATVASIPAMVVSLICGKLFSTRTINVRLVVVTGFAVSAAGAIIIPFATGMTSIYTSTILIGFGCAICMSTLMGFCALKVEDNQRSAAMGVFQAVYGLGMFTGPVLIGIFVDLTGISGGFFAASALAFIGLLLTYMLLEKA